MNDSTEQVMKAWQPRPPSPGLRRRIFASEPEPAFVRQPLAWAGIARWLAPALGCFVLVTGTMMQSPQSPATATASFDGQQQMAQSLYPACEKNNVPSKTVEWTFARASASNSSSIVGSETNTLRK